MATIITYVIVFYIGLTFGMVYTALFGIRDDNHIMTDNNHWWHGRDNAKNNE